jgi:hypothetical protein
MVELNFYISPEDYTRLNHLLEKLNLSEREFLYRAFTRYVGIKEKELNEIQERTEHENRS